MSQTNITNPVSNPVPTSDPNLDNIINEISKAISNTSSVSHSDIISVCISAMQLAEKVPGLDGTSKKALVLQAINSVMTKLGVNQEMLAFLPPFIDTVISVDKGTISIQPKEVENCCLSFLQIFQK